MRLWGINPTNSVLIHQTLTLRSIVRLNSNRCKAPFLNNDASISVKEAYALVRTAMT